MRRSVLFVCVHNSARSQMAEALLNQRCFPEFMAESAGLEPGMLSPLAVAAMKELGIDISRNSAKSISDILRSGKQFDYVVTVCDEASAERCPIFPGRAERLHWSIMDPAALVGSWDERLAATRRIRDATAARIEAWCSEVCEPTLKSA